jgi:hypothetical protein
MKGFFVYLVSGNQHVDPLESYGIGHPASDAPVVPDLAVAFRALLTHGIVDAT